MMIMQVCERQRERERERERETRAIHPQDPGLGGLYDFLPPPDPEKDKAHSTHSSMLNACLKLA